MATNKKLEKLLYPVSKVPLSEILPDYNFNRQQAYAIVVDTPKGKKVVNTCSSQYHLVPNKQIIEPLLETLEGYNIDFLVTNRMDSRFSLDVLLHDIKMDVGKKDPIVPKLRMYNSYDGRLKYQFHMGFFRMICSNGMVVPVEGFEDKNVFLKMRHTPSLGSYVEKNAIIDMIESFKEHSKEFTAPLIELSKSKVGNIEERVKEVINNTKFPTRKIEDVMDRIQVEMGELKSPVATDWLIYNGFNYQLNHNSEIKTEAAKKEKIDQQVLSYLLNH